MVANFCTTLYVRRRPLMCLYVCSDLEKIQLDEGVFIDLKNAKYPDNAKRQASLIKVYTLCRRKKHPPSYLYYVVCCAVSTTKTQRSTDLQWNHVVQAVV